MAINVGEYVYGVSLETSKALSDAKRLEGQLDKTGDSFKEMGDDAKQAGNDTKSFGGSAKNLGGMLKGSVGKITAITGAIAGFTKAMDEASNKVLSADLSVATYQNNLGLTDQQTKNVTKQNTSLGKSYGFNADEMKRLSGLNSNYVGTQEELITANQLVAQTASLYAIKEGDASQAAEMSVTAQEALRDAILTGSTTAFEDAGINLDLLSQKMIENSGYSKEQVAALTEGTNGTFEYTEALWKSISPQERMAALAPVVNEQVQGIGKNMSFAGIAALAWQKVMVLLQNAFSVVLTVLVSVVGGIVLFVGAVVKAIASSAIFKAILTLVKTTVDLLTTTIKNLITQIINWYNNNETLKAALQLLGTTIGKVSTFIVNLIGKVTQIIAKFFAWLNSSDVVKGALSLLGTVITTVITAVANLIAKVVEIAGKFIDWATQSDLVRLALDLLKVPLELLKGLLEFVIPLVKELTQKFKEWYAESELVQTIMEGVATAVDAVSSAIEWGIQKVKEFIGWLDELAASARDSLSNIPVIGGAFGRSANVNVNTNALTANTAGRSSLVGRSGASGGGNSSITNNADNRSFNPNFIVDSKAKAREVQKEMLNVARGYNFIGGAP